MNYILFDDSNRDNLLPFTFTRPVADIRIGILTIREKWEKYLSSATSSITQEYLSNKFKLVLASDNLLINGAVLPNKDLLKQIELLPTNCKLMRDNVVIAARIDAAHLKVIVDKKLPVWKLDIVKQNFDYPYDSINNNWEIFQKNGQAIESDFDLITEGRESASISPTNQVLGDRIFLEEGAKVECAILNSTTGAIYIGKDAEVMEGSVVRGGLALCNNGTLKLATKIYGPTTIGPHSKVGGEVNNSVIFGYSNKGHDGFMGNSVIGEWCNLGADTNTSNLKNNYSNVRVWNYEANDYIDSKEQFCGLLMGDHSKSGINTMFNTGTTVGVCANIFGGDFPLKFIPSFSWGGANGFETFRIEKAFEVGQKVMERRGIDLDSIEKNILSTVFDLTAKHRK